MCLVTMNENSFSCIKQVTKTVRLTMPLKYTTNEIAGVTEILDGWKRQFIPKLQGVVVNYRNVRLSSMPLFIHISRTAPVYNVTATFDVFCPSVGDIVKGKINRTSREHIGCLIEETINATIHLSCNSSPNLFKFTRINQDILFEITRFEFYGHTIRVYGKITPECISLMEEIYPNVPESMPKDSTLKLENNDQNSSSEMSSEESELFGSTSKPEIPVFIKKEMQFESEDNLCNSSIHSMTKLKGSKKRKRDSESPSLSSPKTSKKRKKKGLESVVKNEVISEAESLTSKSKKKKKRKEKPLVDDNLTTNMLHDEIKKEVLFEAELLTANAKSKKKKKQDKKPAHNYDLPSNMLGVGDLASKLATFDIDSPGYDTDSPPFADGPAYVVQQIKNETVCPSSDKKEGKGKKRKHEKSSSDDKVKKKHKLKGTKKDKKKPKNKKKLAKTIKKLLASGNILKKDEKNSKSKKHSKNRKHD